MHLLHEFRFVIFAYFTKSNAHTKIHDNYLYFTHNAYLVSFTVKSHCITSGQPYQTPDGSQAQKDRYRTSSIDIKAGRHGSKDTVNCTINLFDNVIAPDQNAQASDSAPPTPKQDLFRNKMTFHGHGRFPGKLNFAVKGDLTIDEKTFEDIILAQGRAGASNNWWFGGVNCSNPGSDIGKNHVDCVAKDGTDWCFTRGHTDSWGYNIVNWVRVDRDKCSPYA